MAFTDSKKQAITRLHWLDILRGVASLSIVLWHWQHFFMHGYFEDAFKNNEVAIRNTYPLYRFLRPFYGQGWRAVQLFFTLSGFIFFWLYSEKIASRKINFKKYLFFRITRLYPLHWLTLFVVIFVQLWLHHLEGAYFVYKNHGFGAFISNFMLVSNWFSSSFAFNGPSWSVSVEMLLYILFFCLCYIGLNRWWSLIVFIFIGYLLRGSVVDQVGSGIMSFFMGGIVFYLYHWINNNVVIQKKLWISLVLLLTILFLPVYWRYFLNRDLPFYFFELCLFPAILLTIALIETSLGAGIGKRLSFIGDISFSCYLWHFPLQIIFVIAADALGWGRSVFYSPATLGLFYLVLIGISVVSYYKFEYPVQNYLRKRFASPKM
jgi:peptidoglycan/LPS O-acetylase OafA/YrhL